jgi:hypothetical protein
MSQTQTLQVRKTEDLISPLIAAFLIVMFLFYIDEGYNDFRWMKDPGNWFVFVIYMIIFFPVQWVISHFVFGKLIGWKKIVAMVGISIPLSLTVLWLVL